MSKIKISRDENYAQAQPHLPIVSVKKGDELEIGAGITQVMADRIVKLDGGKIVDDSKAPPSEGKKAVIAAKKAVTAANKALKTAKEEGTPDESKITDLTEKVEAAKVELTDAEEALKAED